MVIESDGLTLLIDNRLRLLIIDVFNHFFIKKEAYSASLVTFLVGLMSAFGSINKLCCVSGSKK